MKRIEAYIESAMSGMSEGDAAEAYSMLADWCTAQSESLLMPDYMEMQDYEDE